MSFTIQRTNFYTTEALATSIIQDLKDNGYTLTWVNNGDVADVTTTATQAILETTVTSNSQHATTPWRLMILSYPSNEGNHGIYVYYSSQEVLPANEPNLIFLERGRYDHHMMTLMDGDFMEVSNSHGYHLTITDRGTVLFVYDEANQTDFKLCSMLDIQRPVDQTTGVELITDEAPVFAISKDYNRRSFMSSVVTTKYSTITTERKNIQNSGNGILNGYTMSWPRTSVQEDGTFSLSFLHGLTTQKHVYFQDIDLFCKSCAVEYLFNQGVTVSVYGEASDRTYTTYTSTGLSKLDGRIMILSNNGGI